MKTIGKQIYKKMPTLSPQFNEEVQIYAIYIKLRQKGNFSTYARRTNSSTKPSI